MFAALGSGAVLAVATLHAWRAPHLRRRIIVNLLEEPNALSGVFWAQRGPWIVLRQVQALRPDGSSVQVDGEVVVHRARISFTQVF